MFWLERCFGRSPRGLPSAEEFPNLAAIFTTLEHRRARGRQYLNSLSEGALAKSLSYKDSKGEIWTYPLWRALLHLLNHQTYDRGQVATCCGNLVSNHRQWTC
jgi:uncharacterized damage-inducible protein DinB